VGYGGFSGAYIAPEKNFACVVQMYESTQWTTRLL